MDDTVKYLIHADVTADGVVERSDVVGAIFGQTEGLLGDELDLRGLQQSSKVGRIDVDIDSEQGQSYGHITIETSLDKVATATLAAALETISRIGPCRAKVQISEIEDVRAAKRREIVDRAKELLVEGFSDSVMSSDEILAEVREQVRVENITEFEGLPAGPHVAESDAIIVVEGRADVLKLLQYGIKNAIAVEGTNVPDPIAELTQNRTVTVFLDGDRGGELILEELSQVGEIDYVAFAPPGQSVEDLTRGDIFEALQEKVPYDAVAGMQTPRAAATDGSATPAPESDEPTTVDAGPGEATATAVEAEATVEGDAATDQVDASAEVTTPGDATAEGGSVGTETDESPAEMDEAATEDEATTEEEAEADSPEDEADAHPTTLRGHVDAVVGEGTGTIRLLDDEFATLDEGPVDDGFDLLESAETVPETVVLDGELSQKLLDLAAQRGVSQVVARGFGEFTKRPTSVRIRTADQLAAEAS